MPAKTALIFLAALCLALGLSVAFVMANHDEPSASSNVERRASVQSQSLPVVIAPESASPAGPRSDAPAADAARIFEQYKCTQGLEKCSLDPLIASSAAEAMWLRRNGYPTRKQVEESQALSATQLKQRASQSGDLADRALYAEKLADEGSPREALGLLGDVVTRGGTYGLYSISTVYASSNSDLFNPKLSRAYLRAAYLAGDSKVTGVMVNRFPQFDTPAENYVVDKRASEIHRSFLRGRSIPRP